MFLFSLLNVTRVFSYNQDGMNDSQDSFILLYSQKMLGIVMFNVCKLPYFLLRLCYNIGRQDQLYNFYLFGFHCSLWKR